MKEQKVRTLISGKAPLLACFLGFSLFWGTNLWCTARMKYFSNMQWGWEMIVFYMGLFLKLRKVTNVPWAYSNSRILQRTLIIIFAFWNWGFHKVYCKEWFSIDSETSVFLFYSFSLTASWVKHTYNTHTHPEFKTLCRVHTSAPPHTSWVDFGFRFSY